MTYTTIDHQKQKRLALSPNEYLVASYISNQSKTSNRYGGWCVASKKTISSEVVLSERAVFKIIERLITKRIIERDPATKHLKSTKAWGYEQSAVPMNKVQSDYEQSAVDGLPNQAQNYEQSADNNIQVYLQEQFGTFWKAYPRKIKKKKAYQVWMKLSPDKQLISEIMAGLENWRKSEEWKKNNGQYIPHPPTWLNDRRWEDELNIKTRYC